MRKVVILLIVLLLGGALLSAEELVKNPGFEEWHGDVPSSWALHTWKSTKGVVLSRSDVAHSGRFSVMLESRVDEDSKVFQPVRVEPGALYRFSAWVRVEGVPEDKVGANLSAMESMERSADVKNTGGKWKQIVVYAKAGKKQEAVRLTLRLGGYGALSRGRVWFDDVSFVRVKSVPAGAQVIRLYREESPVVVKHGFPLMQLVLLFLVYVAAALFLYRRREDFAERLKPVNFAAFVLALAFVLRLVVALSYTGHSTDMPTFYGWATELADKGVFSFYGSESFKDYPPGYLYVLYVVGLLIRLSGAEFGSWVSVLLLKLPSMLLDLVAVFVIMREFKGRRGLALAALYAFNPAVIYNSSLYGQVDSVLGLLILLVVLAYRKRRYVLSALWLGIMLAVKPQAMLFAPVGLFFALRVLAGAFAGFYRRVVKKESVKTDFSDVVVLFKALGAFAGSYVALHVPFFIMYPHKFFELYLRIMASYPFVSVNAANFWAMLGYNWKTVLFKFAGLPFFRWQTVIQLLLLVSAGLVYRAEERDSLASASQASLRSVGPEDKSDAGYGTDADKASDSKNAHKEGKPYGAAGASAKASADSSAAASSPVITALFLALLGFTFLMRMHERYLYPAIILSLAAFLITERKGFLALFFSISFSNFINLAQVIYLDKTKTYVIEPDAAFFLASLVCVLSAAGLVLMLFPRAANMAGKALRAVSNKVAELTERLTAGKGADKNSLIRTELAEKEKTDKKSILMLAAIVAVYSVVALINLGSLSTPTTIYRPQVKDTYFVVEKTEDKAAAGIAWYRGYGSGKYTVYSSPDRKNWKQLTTIENNNIWAEFGWQLIKLAQEEKDKYILVKTEKPGQSIHELVIYDKDFKAIALKMPESFRSPQDKGMPENLIDEQKSWNGQIGFFTNMYFDEIYHARTAYEYVNGMRPLETTHPPLGKLIMALGVIIFKMTPFGWRIMGTLIGILMLPVIFLLAKELLKKNNLALIATALLATDCLHFVQTRIATIDSYAVFFIMLMYIPMIRYYLADNKDAGDFKKYAVPLLVSGIFFGLGAASKWTSIYAGGALALLYFLKLITALYKKDINAKQAVINMLWAALSFIAVPLIIYSISYIPFALSEGANSPAELIKLIIREQKGMYIYHSQVKDPHPFASPWWQWPLMIKPMWYYSGQQYLKPGYISSILAIGNPLIFWLGSLSMLALIPFAKRDKTAGLILIFFAFQYLPWAISPRTVTFIYHFFTSVPFIILALVYLLNLFTNKVPGRKKLIFASTIALSIILFAAFYPILSGAVISKSYAELLRWFNTWYFYQ